MSNKHKYPVKVFVFGTLRRGQRLEYYMEGSIFEGMYYTQGQLMKSENGSAYIDFEQKESATIGELYHMSYSGLLRINHLESTSGEFPKAYDIDIVPIWKYHAGKLEFDINNCSYAFIYKLRNDAQKIQSGDWTSQKYPIQEIENFIKNNPEEEIDSEKLIAHIFNILK
jgi:gamma-glutamylcyclotransferase (GGCT)/AIG2-like uncharacterized protein YtfP